MLINFRPAALALLLLASPVAAQAPDQQRDPDEFNLEEFTDAAREALEKLSEEILPMLKDLGERVGELSEYEAPEILPNGDIIIRRKVPLDDPAPDAPQPEDDDTLDL